MAQKITLIPGDGIGPEIAEQMKRCVDATDAGIEWDTIEAGEEVIKKQGTPMPDEVVELIKKNRVAIKGPIITPIGSGFRSVNVALRKQLDLYACLRPCKYYEGVNSNYKGIDLVVVRENTEDLYAGIEFEKGSNDAKKLIEYIKEINGAEIRPDSGISLKPISEFATKRIVRFAFEYAKQNKRKKVSAVTKANIMKDSDGLFMSVAEKVARNYSEIQYEHILVDNMCMQLVQKPHLYDVLVLPNLYGDIISDLCAGLVGGLGVAPGANIGEKYAVFEPTHGAAPKYRGLNKVNPTAIILSAVMMLRYINKIEEAEKLEKAVAAVIKEGKNVTYDLKPSNPEKAVGTKEMADAIIEKME